MIGEFLADLIKYAVLVFAYVGLYRWITTRNDGKRHIQTKVLTIICVLLVIFFFVVPLFQ
ncbi:hypothetical protein [Gilvibacter sediminis]|uniref:hypothetical protein n=1 Tax=Gilvibacter sediminis TaxID=379071 RepID=UPI002350987A|nr:hypothetical protein [Gilvibacter sediminis]MDC7998047.1 hypothetical protein [Gilvibacter sediminis]